LSFALFFHKFGQENCKFTEVTKSKDFLLKLFFIQSKIFVWSLFISTKSADDFFAFTVLAFLAPDPA